MYQNVDSSYKNTAVKGIEIDSYFKKPYPQNLFTKKYN